jgi:hypothetical protein
MDKTQVDETQVDETQVDETQVDETQGEVGGDGTPPMQHRITM